VNAFFSSAKIRNRADATAKKYITALGVWLTFLDRIGRPAEVDLLCADPKKARVQLGWEPTVGFEELVAMMVEADVRLLSDGGDPEQDSSWP
jgi:GDP-D-mannose dehydratase